MFQINSIIFNEKKYDYIDKTKWHPQPNMQPQSKWTKEQQTHEGCVYNALEDWKFKYPLQTR